MVESEYQKSSDDTGLWLSWFVESELILQKRQEEIDEILSLLNEEE